ncbi:hypothetical protein NDU88_002639 [Pleurodeles waltl]|uniref:Uncharacterized protein n=1 Tax=Pleurodeles waltl TaxID=8319 RepID=A0AAV7WLT5_PLEWA|nr:hypothetical protein NDU88_002639 [Pleurodeles waltl]
MGPSQSGGGGRRRISAQFVSGYQSLASAQIRQAGRASTGRPPPGAQRVCADAPSGPSFDYCWPGRQETHRPSPDGSSPRCHVQQERGRRAPVPRCSSGPQSPPRGTSDRAPGRSGLSVHSARPDGGASEEYRSNSGPAARGLGWDAKEGGEKVQHPQTAGAAPDDADPRPQSDLWRAVTTARLSSEGPGARPQLSSAILGPSGPGLAARKSRAEKPINPTEGAAAPLQRGHRDQEGHPMGLDGVSVRGG